MSSQSESSRNSKPTTCHCGRVPVTVTSWKFRNAGRRFLGCERYPDDGYCSFFKWLDPPMCQRSLQIIPGLLRKVDEQNLKMTSMAGKIENLEEKITILHSMNCNLEKQNELLKLGNKKTDAGNKLMDMLVKLGKMILVVWVCFYLIHMFSS